MIATDFEIDVPYVVVFAGKSMVSRLIRWQSRGPWSHAAIVINGQVTEAREGSGVITRRWRTNGYPDNGYQILKPREPVPPENVARMLDFLADQIGKPYDYRQVLRFVWRLGLHPWTVDAWFCSELVFDTFRRGGVDLLAQTEGWEVPPHWLPRSPLLEVFHEKPVPA